jgi:8-oxo-dGTP pyrophosphatase MutT (NUDIX family)
MKFTYPIGYVFLYNEFIKLVKGVIFMKYEKSCGIIPIYIENNEIKVVLIKQNNGVIGFPKGHVENNETEKETALRECFEGTNLEVSIIDGFKEEISYYMSEYDSYKTVVFFIGLIKCFKTKIQESEVSEIFLTTFEDAYNKITFDDTKLLLKKVEQFIENKFLIIKSSKFI